MDPIVGDRLQEPGARAPLYGVNLPGADGSRDGSAPALEVMEACVVGGHRVVCFNLKIMYRL